MTNDGDGRGQGGGASGPIRRVMARGGAALPALGLGTWRMGERRGNRKREVAALHLGLDLGMTLLDTAEMYASGGAEKVVGEAIRGRRDEVYLVSKVLPSNASRKGTIKAAERSLKRLGTERLELYLLHWEGSYPLEETLAAFAQLVQEQKIVAYGVSNFDRDAMREAEALAPGGKIVCNQVVYNLSQRGIEQELLPWCAAREVAVMAYSPLDQAALIDDGPLAAVARRLDTTPATVAVAWTLRRPGIVSIPKAAEPEHLRANRAALDLALGADDLAELDRAYPPPTEPTPLAIY